MDVVGLVGVGGENGNNLVIYLEWGESGCRLGNK